MQDQENYFINFFRHIFKQHTSTAFIVLGILTFAVIIKIFATGPFSFGTNLNPDCQPGEVDCVVNIYPAGGSTGEVLTNDGAGSLTWEDTGAYNPPFEIYLAQVSRPGGVISATEYENTLGNIVWSDGVNTVIGTLAGAFPAGSTVFPPFGSTPDEGVVIPLMTSGALAGYYKIQRVDDDSIEIQLFDEDLNTVDILPHLLNNQIMVKILAY